MPIGPDTLQWMHMLNRRLLALPPGVVSAGAELQWTTLGLSRYAANLTLQQYVAGVTDTKSPQEAAPAAPEETAPEETAPAASAEEAPKRARPSRRAPQDLWRAAAGEEEIDPQETRTVKARAVASESPIPQSLLIEHLVQAPQPLQVVLDLVRIRRAVGRAVQVVVQVARASA